MAKYTGSSHAVALVMTGNKNGNRHWVEKPQTNETNKRRAAAAFHLLNSSSKNTGKGGKR